MEGTTQNKSMPKAMFFEDALNKGILPKITQGYILSVMSPDYDDPRRNMDPFLLEMISYSGVKMVNAFGEGVKFQAQGKKMFCMIEPAAYTQKHTEPTFRPTNSTGFMPFRFSECEQFLTKDSKYNVLIPNKAHDCYDSFTVALPKKGDLSILYFIFDKDVNNVVLPFIEENIVTILKTNFRLANINAKHIGASFREIIGRYHVWAQG